MKNQPIYVSISYGFGLISCSTSTAFIYKYVANFILHQIFLTSTINLLFFTQFFQYRCEKFFR